MPRPKKYENDADRHAAYRERRSDKLGALAHLAGQMLGIIPLDNEDATDRKTAYRKRAADERQAVKHVGAQVQGEAPPDAPFAAAPEVKWFRVVIETATGGKPEYVMEQGELERLQSDHYAVRTGTWDGVHTSGTYVFANQGPILVKFPGTFTVDLATTSIIETGRIADFTPSDTYSIQAGIMALLLSQKPRPKKTKMPGGA